MVAQLCVTLMQLRIMMMVATPAAAAIAWILLQAAAPSVAAAAAAALILAPPAATATTRLLILAAMLLALLGTALARPPTFSGVDCRRRCARLQMRLRSACSPRLRRASAALLCSLLVLPRLRRGRGRVPVRWLASSPRLLAALLRVLDRGRGARLAALLVPTLLLKPLPLGEEGMMRLQSTACTA